MKHRAVFHPAIVNKDCNCSPFRVEHILAASISAASFKVLSTGRRLSSAHDNQRVSGSDEAATERSLEHEVSGPSRGDASAREVEMMIMEPRFGAQLHDKLGSHD
jgi:hypothetical protein